MIDSDDFTGPCFPLIETEPAPDPLAKLPELARRLDVAPRGLDRPATVAIEMQNGERYCLFELIHALLDRMDGVTRP